MRWRARGGTLAGGAPHWHFGWARQLRTGHSVCMGLQFDDLPRWEFSAVERSPGIYEIRAVRDGGVTGESTGSDYDTLLEDLKQWARGVEDDLARRNR